MLSSAQNRKHRVFGSVRSAFTSAVQVDSTSQYDLDILERAITAVEKKDDSDQKAEGLVSQVLPEIIAEETNTLNPKTVGSAVKEKLEPAVTGQSAMEMGQSTSYIETGPVSPELSPEVEGYLEKVRDDINKVPREIVIADGQADSINLQNSLAKPVVIIPITPEEEKEGAKKSPKFSIRWLVEWSRKIIKIFAGKVVYRQAEKTV